LDPVERDPVFESGSDFKPPTQRLSERSRRGSVQLAAAARRLAQPFSAMRTEGRTFYRDAVSSRSQGEAIDEMTDVWLPQVVARFEPRKSAERLLHPRTAPEEALSYIVVDEIEEEVAVLLCEPWPELDERGRPRFDEDQRTSVQVGLDALYARLRRRQEMMRLTEEDRAAFAERPVRVGDAFAGLVDREALAADTDSLTFLDGPIVDVTAEAREAAKLQHYATAAPLLSDDDVEALYSPEGDGGETTRLA
jgi:hypothetical protein